MPCFLLSLKLSPPYSYRYWKDEIKFSLPKSTGESSGGPDTKSWVELRFRG
jgi:hypothetical protein